MVTEDSNREWVFLLHRQPREPSAPRIALWRSLRRLGAVRVGDGVVALPADERTVEHFEWLAAGIVEGGGAASVWLARPSTTAAGDRLREQAIAAVQSEYLAVIREASLGEPADARRVARRLRRQLRAITSRDYFAAAAGDRARDAVEALVREPVKV